MVYQTISQQVVHLGLGRSPKIVEIVPNHLTLLRTRKKLGESFREFNFCRREQEARVDLPMREGEMVDYFLQMTDPTYFWSLGDDSGKVLQ